MSTDIKLNESHVIVEGHTLAAKCVDIVLDGGPGRRPNDKKPGSPRRALVHDFNDGLTLNYGRDYPGGIAALGTLRVEQIAGVNPGHNVKIVASDLLLDAPERRKSPNGYRRALVHDANDGLTINWGRDYPGGVTISGVVRVEQLEGVTHQLKLGCADVIIDNPGRRKVAGGLRRALVHGPDDNLCLNWGADYPGGVAIGGDVRLSHRLFLADKDVAATLAAQQQQIADQTQKLAQLTEQIQQLAQRVTTLEGAVKLPPQGP